MILGPGKVPAWGYAGDQIGDILTTARNPGAGYLQATGDIYLQASYPALFSKLGLIGGQRGINFSTVTATLPAQLAAIQFGENNTVILATIDGRIRRSTNNGNSFVDVTLLNPAASVRGIVYAGSSVWLVLDGNGRTYRSTDDGITWGGGVTRAPNSFGWATDGAGTICLGSTTSVIMSTDYGVTWQTVYNAGVSLLGWGGGKRWLFITSGQQLDSIIITDDNFANIRVSNTGLVSATPGSIGYDPASNTILVASSATAGLNMSVSVDGGFTWRPITSGAGAQTLSLLALGNSTWIAVTGTSTTNPGRISVDGGKTFGPITGSTAPASARYCATDGKGRTIVYATATTNPYAISDMVLGYDPATQFKVPSLPKQDGVINYIRAI